MMTSMRRLHTATAALLLLLGVLAVDHAVSAPLNPYRAPLLFAFGSGAPAGGAHCAGLPSSQ